MGRGGFEPPTHGFSGHKSNDISSCNTKSCENQKTCACSCADTICNEHPELEQIIKTWPTLPEHIKSVILHLINKI
jgi:hypothetical protein